MNLMESMLLYHTLVKSSKAIMLLVFILFYYKYIFFYVSYTYLFLFVCLVLSFILSHFWKFNFLTIGISFWVSIASHRKLWSFEINLKTYLLYLFVYGIITDLFFPREAYPSCSM